MKKLHETQMTKLNALISMYGTDKKFMARRKKAGQEEDKKSGKGCNNFLL